MCYNNNKDENARAEIRSSGLQCLATMVKRLVPEESLSASFIWENMDKIVPALLFIMQESYLKVGIFKWKFIKQIIFDSLKMYKLAVKKFLDLYIDTEFTAK
jgi:hypothetical protein